MRIIGILVVLTLIAFATDCKPLGALVLLFLMGCSLYGLADSAINGSFDVSEQRKRQWAENPEKVVEDFNLWKQRKGRR